MSNIYKSMFILLEGEYFSIAAPGVKLHPPKQLGFPGGSVSKESACNAEDQGFIPWVRKIPWRRKWQPIPVFLPRKSHGQRSLAGYSP